MHRFALPILALMLAGCSGAPFTATEIDPPDAAPDAAPDAPDAAPDTLDAPDGSDADTDAPDAGTDADACTPVLHNNGTVNFHDCVPAGAWSQALALDACRAYFGPDAGVPCHAATCGGTLVVEASNAACISWAYGGTPTDAIGHWAEGPVSGPCTCPTASDGAWY